MDFVKKIYENKYEKMTNKDKNELKKAVDLADRGCVVICEEATCMVGELPQLLTFLTAFMRAIIKDCEEEIGKEEIKGHFEDCIKLAFMNRKEIMMEAIKTAIENLTGDEDGE